MTKHTPGPWKAKFRFQAFDGDSADGTAASAFSQGWVELPGGSRIPVFLDENTQDEAWLEEWKANTYLIAASLQMRDALKAVDEWLMDPFDDKDAENTGYNVQFRKALKLARAALKAADGEKS